MKLVCVYACRYDKDVRDMRDIIKHATAAVCGDTDAFDAMILMCNTGSCGEWWPLTEALRKACIIESHYRMNPTHDMGIWLTSMDNLTDGLFKNFFETPRDATPEELLIEEENDSDPPRALPKYWVEL